MATSKTLLPPPYLTLEDSNGYAVTGGTVTFLDTGTAILATVYADANGLVVSANPLTVDAAGRYTVFLTPGQVVDVEYRDPFGALIKTVPGVQAVPSASGNVDVSGVVGDGPFGVGTLYYIAQGDGRWHLANANTVYRETLGVAVAPTSAPGSAAVFRTAGRLEGYSGLVVGAFYYTSNTGGALSLTPGLIGRLVGQADSTTSLVLWPNPPAIDQPCIGGMPAESVITALVVTHPTMALTNTGPITIHGIKAGYHGQRVRFIQYNGGRADFVHNSGSTALANRLGNIATSAPTTIAGNGTAGIVGLHGSIEYEYDLGHNYWRMVAHEQGGWIPAPYAASDFTATGGAGGTWNVPAGTVQNFRYVLRGRALTISLYLGGTTISGAPQQLRVVIPGGFAAGAMWTGATRAGQAYDALGVQEAVCGPDAVGGHSIAIQKNTNAAWGAGGSPVMLLSLTIEVQ